MSSAAVKTAVEAKLATWSRIADCPFYDENDVAAVPSKQYVTVEYPIAAEDRVNVGAKPALFRETGTIRFVIHILNMSGLTATTMVDTLRDLFREQTFDGVETFESSPVAFDKTNRAGGFYLLPFVVPYKFDVLR